LLTARYANASQFSDALGCLDASNLQSGGLGDCLFAVNQVNRLTQGFSAIA
jgi:hypothetical protein